MRNSGAKPSGVNASCMALTAPQESPCRHRDEHGRHGLAEADFFLPCCPRPDRRRAASTRGISDVSAVDDEHAGDQQHGHRRQQHTPLPRQAKPRGRMRSATRSRRQSIAQICMAFDRAFGFFEGMRRIRVEESAAVRADLPIASWLAIGLRRWFAWRLPASSHVDGTRQRLRDAESERIWRLQIGKGSSRNSVQRVDIHPEIPERFSDARSRGSGDASEQRQCPRRQEIVDGKPGICEMTSSSRRNRPASWCW